MVDKAEQMLEELLSTALEISLSAEERKALLSKRARKKCIFNKIRQKISVPLQLHGKKVFIFGKSGDTKEAKEILEEEFRLVKEV